MSSELRVASLRQLKVLVVEDSDAKYCAIRDVLLASLDAPFVDRAPTVTEAEYRITEEEWDLVILDVSMDITSSSLGPKRGGHATLGGIEIAKKMYLLGHDINTIIITAFDAFQASASTYGTSEMLGLEDIQLNAKEILKDRFLGCIRYGETNWSEQFRTVLRGASL